MDIKKRKNLTKIINLNNFDLGVEIGVFKGEYSKFLLENCPNLFMYCVDLWDSSAMSKKNMYNGDELFEKVFLEFQEKYKDRFSLMRKSSVEASYCFENNSLDFIYIDADHSYSAVCRDIESWWKKLKIGGLFGGHDYSSAGIKGVIKAVSKYFDNINVTKERCPSWWLIKESEDFQIEQN